MTKLLKIFLAVILLLCLLHMPYGYYTFVRLMGLIGFGALAIYYASTKKGVLSLVFISLAVLFQPFVKVVLSRLTWNVIDVIVAIFLFALFFIDKKAK